VGTLLRASEEQESQYAGSIACTWDEFDELVRFFNPVEQADGSASKTQIGTGRRYLLCISGIDAIENCKIYKTYMHFGQISDNGKLSAVRTPSNLGLIFEHISTILNEVQITQYIVAQ
jgi:hypothetical protein